MTTLVTTPRDGLSLPGAHYNRTDDDDIAKARLHWPTIENLLRTRRAIIANEDCSKVHMSHNDMLHGWKSLTYRRQIGSRTPSRTVAMLDGFRQFGSVNGSIGIQGSVTAWTGVGANPHANQGIRPISTAIQGSLVDAALNDEVGVVGAFLLSTADTTALPALVYRGSAATDAEHVRIQFQQTNTLKVIRRVASTDTDEATVSGTTAPGNWVVFGARCTGDTVVPFLNGVRHTPVALSGTAAALTGTFAGFRFAGGAIPLGSLLYIEIFSL